MFNLQLFTKIYASAKWAFNVLGLLIIIAIFGNLLASERTQLLPPLVPYAFYTQDSKNVDFVSPFSNQDVSSVYYRHWLGTDLLGRDVLAGLIAGTRTAMSVGIGGMGIALLIGLFFGMVAGYYGDHSFPTLQNRSDTEGVHVSMSDFLHRCLFSAKSQCIILLVIFIGIYLIIRFLEKIIKNFPVKFFIK